MCIQVFDLSLYQIKLIILYLYPGEFFFFLFQYTIHAGLYTQLLYIPSKAHKPRVLDPDPTLTELNLQRFKAYQMNFESCLRP